MRYSAIALTLWVALTGAASAQGPAPPVEPEAVRILKATGDRLAAARTLSFTATAVHDVPNADGQSILYVERSRVEMRRPGMLRVVTLGDGPPSEFLTDGRTMTLFRPTQNTVATAPVAASFDDTIRSEVETFGQTQAFADILVADPAKALTEGLTRAFVVGRSRLVGDVETDIVSFAAPGAQAQIWIGTRDRLPRQLWVTQTDVTGRPRNGVTFTQWSLDRPIPDRAFSAARASRARSVPFAKPEP